MEHSHILMENTVAAIASAVGGGIGVIRISGREASSILRKVFRGCRGDFESHKLYHGHIIDNEDGDIVDEVMAVLMRSPKSYTGEDVAEIHCHGGLWVMQRVLQVLFKNGAEPAQPGEFSKRAFLNGRMDLSQAEAVMDIISARTELARKAAMSGLMGNLMRDIDKLGEGLLECLSSIEASIDYPEYEETALQQEHIQSSLTEITLELAQLIHRSKNGRLLREGIDTVLLGRPNVGKSSLLNALVDDNRAIVTDIPGTTRDILTETIQLGGIPLNLHDTAGIRDTEDEIEGIGVRRSLNAAEHSDLLLLLLDGSQPLHGDDYKLLKDYCQRNLLVLVNKCDLPSQLDLTRLYQYLPQEQVLTISAKRGLGFDELEGKIRSMYFDEGSLASLEHLPAAANLRQLTLLENAAESLEKALDGMESGMPEDLVAIDIRAAYDALGSITGRSVEADLLDNIFSRFCLGK